MYEDSRGDETPVARGGAYDVGLVHELAQAGSDPLPRQDAAVVVGCADREVLLDSRGRVEASDKLQPVARLRGDPGRNHVLVTKDPFDWQRWSDTA